MTTIFFHFAILGRFLSSVILVFSLQQIHSQTLPLGNFFIKNFSTTSYKSDSYNASPQNWAFSQDSMGIVYVGNTTGVLQFDGNKWRMVANTEELFCNSFAKDGQGRIYTGSSGDLGYLDYDHQGRIHFKSMLEMLDEKDRTLGEVLFA